MLLELTEILRCPASHQESYVVCVPIEMDGRRVVRGGIGCPVCHAEYPVADGVAYFGVEGEERVSRASAGAVRAVRPREPARAAPSPAYDASALQAFINLEGRGGYALLVGSAARLGPEIAALIPGVHFFGVNPPGDVAPSAAFSVLRCPRALPVKTQSVRAVVLGADHAAEPWVSDGVRVLLNGLRLVVEDERASLAGIAELARGAGILVGEKRAP